MTQIIARERRVVLSTELETMWNRLVEIAAEIARSEPNSETYEAACRSTDDIAALRWMVDKEQHRTIEKIQQKLIRERLK